MKTRREIELTELEQLGFTEKCSKIYSNSDYDVFEVKEELEMEEDTYLYNVEYCIQIRSEIVVIYSNFQDVIDFYEDEYKQSYEEE